MTITLTDEQFESLKYLCRIETMDQYCVDSETRKYIQKHIKNVRSVLGICNQCNCEKCTKEK